MNDPNGTITSPPIVKPHNPSAPQHTTVLIGRHIITLTRTELFVNRTPLHMDNRDMGLQFLETLKQHPGLLDSLDQALGQGLENWNGIPGWVVRPSMEATEEGAARVRNV